MGLDMSAGSTSQATGDSGDCAQRLHSWMILKLSPFGPNSKNWNSWSETTLRELVQTNRLVPILKEISGEPNVPCTEVLGTEHESPYGDSEDAEDSVILRGQQPMRNGVQPLLSVTLSVADSGSIIPQFSSEL